MDRCGWRLFECCIYARQGRPGPWWRTRFRVDHEYILIFLKGERPRRSRKSRLMIPTKYPGRAFRASDRQSVGTFKRCSPRTVHPMKCRGTVWTYTASSAEGNRLKLRHPATFPDKLAEDLILCVSEEGDLVLDPMCGSGTTPVMAKRHRRRFLGIEIGPGYAAIARIRRRREAVGPVTFPVSTASPRR